MAALFAFAVVAAVLCLAYLVNGWALQLLWGWFAVPLGAPALSLPWAIGIGIMVALLANHYVPRKGEEIDAAKTWGNVFFRPVFAVAVGWIVRSFM